LDSSRRHSATRASPPPDNVRSWRPGRQTQRVGRDLELVFQIEPLLRKDRLVTRLVGAS